MRNTVTETKYIVKTTSSHFNSCMGVSLGDIAHRVKDFGYTITNLLDSTVTASACGMVMGSAPASVWESYCIAANLFLNNFIKIEKFL
jgi:hypothetical protein